MGAQVSVASNGLDNTVKAAVKSFVESKASSQVSVACSNKQIVDGARGCDIQFADQICNAVGLSNFTSNLASNVTVSQDLMNSISAVAEATNSGMAILMAQVSDTSNTVKNAVEMSLESTQKLSTSCTRSVSAINEQTVKNCDASVIRFKPQTASSEFIGDCVANQISSLESAQKLKNAVDMGATSTNKGIELWELLLLLAGGLFLFIFGIPIFMYSVGSAKDAITKKDEKPEDTSAAAQHTKGRLYVVAILFVILLAISCVWWPGYFAWKLGIAPYSFPGALQINGTANPCFEGKSVDPNLYVNSFMWYDAGCTSTKALTKDGLGDGTGKEADNCNKFKAYKQCGIFAEVFGCDDPVFLSESARYKKVLEACGPLTGESFKRCVASDVAASVFEQNVNTYAGCMRCDGSTDAEKASSNPQQNFNLWRRVPAIYNTKDWNVNADQKELIDKLIKATKPEEWGSCATTNISPYAYLRQPGDPACDSADADCYESQETFMKASPGECLNSAYQKRKRLMSDYMKRCDKIQQFAKFNQDTEGEIPLFSKQCAPNVFDYLSKCGSDQKCTYTPSACKCDSNGENCNCSAADSRTIASCKNDLPGCCVKREDGTLECVDPDYRADLLAYDRANSACKQQYDQWKSLNPWGWVIALVLQVMLLGAMIFIMLRDPPTQAQFLSGWRSPQTKKAWGTGSIVLGLVLIVISGWPIGLLAVGYAGKTGSVYSEEYIKKELEGAPDAIQHNAVVFGWIGFSIGVLLFVVGIIFTIKNKIAPDDTGKPIVMSSQQVKMTS